ncbi:MAG: hypothetical protein FJY17_00265 [Bacteroidetes bacterium]|nr:hypothetical protein [Bacteroidota bacterium]
MTYNGHQSVTPFLDVLFSLLLCCLTIILVVNHKSKESDSAPKYQAVYSIVMEWPAKSNDDMDLWAKDAYGHIVGFNRREGGEGSLMSLAHDNLGRSQNQQGAALEVNQEVITLRGTTIGEYVVNVHCYRKDDAISTPVSVKLVKIKPFAEIITKTNTFITAGDEITFFRFSLDKDGKAHSFNSLQESVAKNSP